MTKANVLMITCIPLSSNNSNGRILIFMLEGRLTHITFRYFETSWIFQNSEMGVLLVEGGGCKLPRLFICIKIMNIEILLLKIIVKILNTYI